MGLFDALKRTVDTKHLDKGAAPRVSSGDTLKTSNTDNRDDASTSMSAGELVIKNRLLFVGTGDDWFQSIERELRRLQPGWGCQSVADDKAATSALKDNSFYAVIISSKIFHAAPLNAFIGEQSAATVRIILCDTTDRTEVGRWSAAGANAISQAVDAATLSTTVARLARVQGWMLDAGMKKLISQCRKLPAMPKLYSQVTAELSLPNSSLEKVAEIIAKDPVMTAKILQVVNSAYFGLGREITEAYEAVLFLGAERTRSLVLLAGVFTQFDDVKCPGFSVDQVWNHSIQVGTMARTITVAEVKNIKMAEAAFTAGLIHDMGKLVLAANVPTMCSGIEQLQKTKQVSQREAELQVLGTTHAELAACLLGTWSLPLPVLEAVAWHHCPQRSEDNSFTLLSAVHAANVFAYEAGAGTATKALPEKFDHEYLLQIECGDRRNDWRKACGIPLRQEEDGEHAKFRARREAKVN